MSEDTENTSIHTFVSQVHTYERSALGAKQSLSITTAKIIRMMNESKDNAKSCDMTQTN